MPGLNERDIAAIQEALTALEDVGFVVTGIDDATQQNNRLQFSLTVNADTWTKKTRDDDNRAWMDNPE